jgi:DNA-binding transcriptional regulator YbjK
LELNALNTNLSTRLDSLAAVVVKQAEEKCASSLPPFFSSPACIASQELTKTTKSLQSGLASYFALVRSRYQLYRDVSSKEAEGCVKRGFTERLLKANEEHVIEQEELARTKLLELINAADEIYRLQRP